MTHDPNPIGGRPTLVILRDAADGASQAHLRCRAGAVRGTSAYLGSKGSNLKVFAKRLGRTAAPSSSSQPHAAAPAPLSPGGLAEAPRLYHGLPSTEGADEIPVESTRVIHSLETELMALEGRLQHRNDASDATSPETPGARPTFADVMERNVNAAEKTPISSGQGVSCASSGRWDDFGRDSRIVEGFAPIATFLAERYFRTVVTGIENIPAQDACLLVANHSGALPIDGLVLKSAIWAADPEHRHIRWLTEDFVQNLPFVGTYLQRLGAVRASRENAARLLESGECVAAFPEGFKGYAKPVAQWYRVQRLGRGRVVALCLQARVKLLPCAIVGGEEATPSLRRLEAMERWLGMPYFPITPTFPWLGPLGLLPAPSRWYIDIGPPFLTGEEPSGAEDPLYVTELTSQLRTTLQQQLDRLVLRRKSTWFG